MRKEERDLIQRQLDYLVHNTTNLMDLCIKFISSGVLSQDEVQMIGSRPTDLEKNHQLYLILMHKGGADILKRVISCLQASGNGNESVAEFLMTSSSSVSESRKSESKVKRGPFLYLPVQEVESIGKSFLHDIPLRELKTFGKVKVGSKGSPEWCLIQGMHGMGKTTLAKAFARYFQEEWNGNCLWMNAKGSLVMSESINGIAKSLRIEVDGKNEFETCFERILDEINKCAETTLFILDGVTKLNAGFVTRFLNCFDFQDGGNCKNVKILVTSHEDVEDLEEVLECKFQDAIHLSPLSQEDSRRFFAKTVHFSKNPDTKIHKYVSEDLKTTVQILKGHPTALNVAALFINARMADKRVTTYSISSFLRSLKNERNAIGIGPSGHVAKVVLTHIDSKCTTTGKVCRAAVDALALFDPNDLPVKLFKSFLRWKFTNGWVKSVGNLLRKDFDEEHLKTALKFLTDYGILEELNETYSISAALKESLLNDLMTRDMGTSDFFGMAATSTNKAVWSLAKNIKGGYAKCVSDFMAFVTWCFDTKIEVDASQCQALMSHLLTFDQETQKYFLQAYPNIVHIAFMSMYSQELLLEAKDFQESWMKILESCFKDGKPIRLNARHDLGLIMGLIGHLEEAKSHLFSVSEAKKVALGEAKVSTLNSMALLAAVMIDQDRTEDATSVFANIYQKLDIYVETRKAATNQWRDTSAITLDDALREERKARQKLANVVTRKTRVEELCRANGQHSAVRRMQEWLDTLNDVEK